MNEYNALKDAIRAAIKPNGEYALTAQILQNILIAIVDSFGKGYQFMGIATADTDPGEPDEKEFYVGFAGEYANFGSETVTVPVGGVVIFLYDTEWRANVVKVAERVAVSGNHLEIDGVRSIIEQDIVNVNTLTSQGEAFLTAAAARAAVAAESGLRMGGQVITYLVETDEEHHTAWVVDQFTGDDAEGWENDDNWQPFLYVELAKIVSNQAQINEAIMEALGNRYTKEQIDGMIEPLSERMATAEEGLADRYTKEQSDVITDALDERLETVEELGQIMVEGGEIGIATAADIANPTTANKAKVPTVGALLESGLTVLDISALYPTGGESSTDHYTLAGAIAMVDSDYQKGGISIKFKDAGKDGYPYVQYTLMSAAWSNSVNLWRGADAVGYLNVNEVNQQSAAYNNAAAARAAVPAVLRAPGLQITYLVTSGTESIWVQDLYIGAAADSTSWGNAANWKTNGPVGVSQNTDTGRKELHIGNEAPNVLLDEEDSNLHIGTFVAAFEEEDYEVTDTSASIKPTRVIPNQRVKVYVKSSTLSHFAVYAYPASSATLIKEFPQGTDFSNGIEFEFVCPAEMQKDQYGVTKIQFRTWAEVTLDEFDCWRLEPNNSTAFDDIVNILFSQITLNTVQSTSAIYEMITGEAFRFSQIQYDSDGKVTSAIINWGDGASGVMTINYDSSGVVTYIDYTKGTGGLGNTGTYRQSFVYYSNGNVQGNVITKIE